MSKQPTSSKCGGQGPCCIVLKGAAVTKTTRAHWHTCSLLLNFTQYLYPMVIKLCSCKTKTDTFERILKKRKYSILRCATSTISVKQDVVTLPDRTGNPRMIHPTTNMLSIAVSPYIAVNYSPYIAIKYRHVSMLQCSKPFLFILGSFF